jgi:hypothetical protein
MPNGRKYTKWPLNTQNGREIYQHFPFQGTRKLEFLVCKYTTRQHCFKMWRHHWPNTKFNTKNYRLSFCIKFCINYITWWCSVENSWKTLSRNFTFFPSFRTLKQKKEKKWLRSTLKNANADFQFSNIGPFPPSRELAYKVF